MEGRRIPSLALRVAKNQQTVTEAWRTVYQAYRRADLIESNPHRIHTTPEACGPQSAVICGCIGPLIVSTLTATADSQAGLRLDRVYPQQLGQLRREDRRLLEVGFFADRRTHFDRCIEALFHLSRYALHYAVYCQLTDILVGVHPRHSMFYERSLGFQILGDASSHPDYNDQPVVLLHIDLEQQLGLETPHSVLEKMRSQSVHTDVFDNRFRFDEESMHGSPIRSYLQSTNQDC